MTAREVLDGIKARTEAATLDGLTPWRRVMSSDGTGTGVVNSSGSVIGYGTGTDAAELLAHAPKDLIRLTAALEAVLSECDYLDTLADGDKHYAAAFRKLIEGALKE